MRIWKLIWKYSLLFSSFISFVLMAYYFIFNTVPAIHSIKFILVTCNLPMGINRLWDIALGPIYATFVVFILCQSKTDLNLGMVMDFIAGCAFMFILILIFDLNTAMYVALVFAFFFSVMTGMMPFMCNPAKRIDDDSTSCFGFGMAAIVFTGLFQGLMSGLIYGLVAGIVFIIIKIYVLAYFFCNYIMDWLLWQFIVISGLSHDL